jgi:hypothetical protein
MISGRTETMPVTLHLTTTTTCRWAISPLRETTSAIRLLTRPDRQGYHQPWLQAVAPALADLDLTPLLAVLRFRYNPDFLMPAPSGPSPVFADELALVRRTRRPRCGPSCHAASTRSTAAACRRPRRRSWIIRCGHALSWPTLLRRAGSD